VLPERRRCEPVVADRARRHPQRPARAAVRPGDRMLDLFVISPRVELRHVIHPVGRQHLFCRNILCAKGIDDLRGNDCPRAAGQPWAAGIRIAWLNSTISATLRSLSSARSTVAPYFPALRYSNNPERLGSVTPPGNGPKLRIGSPDGGSIFVTSAPRSRSNLVQYGPAMSPAISTTRKPARAAARFLTEVR